MSDKERERIEIRRTKQDKTEFRISDDSFLDYEKFLKKLTKASRVDFRRILADGKECYSFGWQSVGMLIVALEPVDLSGDPLEIIAEKLCKNVKIVMDAFNKQDKKKDESYVFYI